MCHCCERRRLSPPWAGSLKNKPISKYSSLNGPRTRFINSIDCRMNARNPANSADNVSKQIAHEHDVQKKHGAWGLRSPLEALSTKTLQFAGVISEAKKIECIQVSHCSPITRNKIQPLAILRMGPMQPWDCPSLSSKERR